MSDASPSLSVVIVNFNGERFLRECISSLREHLTSASEIIVVDNASQDTSCEIIEREFPDVVLIKSEINTGFTGGNNLGARRAKGDLLLLLNNDTRTLTDVAPAVAAFSDPHLGAIGCRLVYGDGRPQPSLGYEHSPIRVIFSWAGFAKINWLPSTFRRSETRNQVYESYQSGVAWVSGAFLMTRRALWEELGGLDLRYFMYIEDIDYCRRVRERGFRIDYTPSVKIMHYEGAGRAWIGRNALLHTMASYLIYTRKFYGELGVLSLKVLLAPIMLARSFAYALLSLVGRNEIWRDKRRSYFSAAVRLCRDA